MVPASLRLDAKLLSLNPAAHTHVRFAVVKSVSLAVITEIAPNTVSVWATSLYIPILPPYIFIKTLA